MAYTRVHADWQDDPSTATPILAADLEHIETGIVLAAQSSTETQEGNVQLATPTEMTAGTDLKKVPTVKRVADYVTASLTAVSNPIASETLAGIVELATAAEITTGTDLTRAVSPKRIVDYINTRLTGTGGTAASETVAGVVELASAAEMTAGTDLTRTPAVKRVADYVATAISALSTTLNTALTAKADKSGSWKQFADVADTVYTDGDTPVFSSGVLAPTDLSLNFAGLDGALRLDPVNFPQWYTPIIVIEEGTNPPGTFPTYGLVGKLPAAASLIPTLFDTSSVRAANSVLLTLPEAVAVGGYIGFSVGFSSETPIDHISAAFGGTGAGAGLFDYGTVSIPNTTAGVLNGFVKLTTAASLGSTITFTSRDVSNSAINRVHLIATMYRLPNLVSSVPRDQQAVSGGTSSSTLTAIGASIVTNTSQPSEVAIGAAINSAGSVPNSRDIVGTNGWTTISDHLSDNGTTARRLYVGYKVLTTVAQPALTTTVTLSGTATQTGIWAAKLDTFKGI